MKQKKWLMLVAFAALLAACGGRGDMKMGDNEYPVMTVGTQGRRRKPPIPLPSRVNKTWR